MANQFCASCISEGPGLRPCQLDEGGPIFLYCERCDSEVPGRPYGPSPASPAGAKWIGSCYFPLDEIKRQMPIMILRALRRSDWMRSNELSEALGVPSSIEDPGEQNRYSVTLSRLCRQGQVDTKVVRARPVRKSQSRRHTGLHEWKEYRISPLGIARLEWSLGATMAA